MVGLNEVIDSREIDIKCWQCDWVEPRSLNWVSEQRHMNCPVCDSVIVLDSSEVRREVSRQRRQLAALHGQMVNLLESAANFARPSQGSSRANAAPAKLNLALAQSHPNLLSPSQRFSTPRRSQR